MSFLSIEELQRVAGELRGRIIHNSHQSRTPHLGSCLSLVDILTVSYYGGLEIDPKQPHAIGRDRFVLSKGHGAPALFQALAMKGFFPEKDLETYGEDGGIFAEHPPTPDHLPGIEAATGSLGHGLPMGLGMALAAKIRKRNNKVVVVLGDGECNEGSVWEAAMMASAQQLDNLIVIVDFNKWQATDRSEEVLHLSPLVDKWRAFGWDACEIDGHDMAHLVDVFQMKRHNRPLAVVAHTIKGKGVSFMEDDNNWHYRIPSEEEVSLAFKELGLS